MENQTNKDKSLGKTILTLIFILECFALPTQFYLLMSTTEFTIWEAIVRLFSFFTVLTNSIVALCCGILLFRKTRQAYIFFSKNTTLTAITVYIIIVGLVYNIILRPLQRDLAGFHRITTEIFHSAVPVLFLLYWLFFVLKQNIPWKSILAWLIYPLLYVIYTIIHGKYTNFYPYPFINVSELGFAKAMQNGVVILISIIVLSCILIVIGKITRKNHKS